MFSLQHKYPNVSARLIRESFGYGGRKVDRASVTHSWKNSLKNAAYFVIFSPNTKKIERERGFELKYFCSSSSSSSSSISSADHEEVELGGKLWVGGKSEEGKEKGEFGCLVREYGWNVRRMVEEKEEMRKVAHVQAQAFHEPVFLFDDLFFQFFQAEVLSGLLYRLRNSAPDRYACLVAEPNFDASESQKQLVGVVDVTVSREEAVLQHLPGVEEYLYVSGIAVLNDFRRQKVATALLKACDQLSTIWGYRFLVLRAYEDDLSARKLYTNAGYRVVSEDPPWITLIGRKRRVIMIKQPDSCE